MSKGIGIHSIADVAVAMVDETEEPDEKGLIRQLEEIIEELKKKETMEN